MVGHKDCNFSFSGLKTAVRHKAAQLATIDPQSAADLAAATQRAIATSLADRTRRALELAPQPPTAVVVAGGVAANREVRQKLSEVAAAYGLPMIAPPVSLCGDNAAMIGWAALERCVAGLGPEDNGRPRPRWPLDRAPA